MAPKQPQAFIVFSDGVALAVFVDEPAAKEFVREIRGAVVAQVPLYRYKVGTVKESTER